MVPVNIAIEDELSEVILRKILGHVDKYSIGTAYRRGGFGYLKRTIAGWNNAAKSIPFIVLSDLDAAHCPMQLIRDWLPAAPHPNLIIRIAVREVESWVLADGEGFAAFLGIKRVMISAEPDSLYDPKAELIKLARKSRKKTIRDSIVPKTASTAKQGPAYNESLAHFVKWDWNVERATQRSPSLAKAVAKLSVFVPVWA